MRFSDSDPLIKNIEITIDGSPVDADLVADGCVLEFVTGVGGSDSAEAVEVFGLLDGSVLGEFFVEEEQEVGFCEVVPDRWVVCLVEGAACSEVCARGVVEVVSVVLVKNAEAEF